MKNFNLLRKSERKSVGTTLALTVGSPSAHRRYSALKHLTFMLLFLLGSLNVWGEKITNVANIESGKTYYIGATTSNTDYYFSVNGSTASSSVVAGTAITDKSSAATFVFTQSGSNWTIKFSDSDNYLSLSSSKNNGKVIVNTTANWTISNNTSKSLLTLACGNTYALQKNNSGTQFGSYAKTQTDVWLEEVPSGSSDPTLSAAPTTIDFGTVEQGASVAAKTVAVTYANLTGSVTYSGLSDAFAATGTISASGDEITITPSTATIGEYEQTLTIQSTADSKSQDVTVTMNVVAPFDGKKLTFDVSSNPGEWPTSNSTTTTNYTYTLNEVDYTFALNNVKCNSGYLMLTSVAKLGLPAISGYKLVKVEATNSGSCSTSTQVSVSSSDASKTDVTGGAAQTWGTTSTKYTYNLSGTEENTMYYLWIANKNCQIVELTLYYEETEASAVAKPTISGETPFLTSTEVTLTQAEADHIYYTTNGDDPTTSSTEYTAPFELNATATVKAIAVKGSDESAVAEATFTKQTVLTVAEALLGAAGSGKYVTGTITSITEVNIGYKNATYVISDISAGIPQNEMIVYRGKYIDGADFTSADQIHVGDVVVVSGSIAVHAEKNQMAQGNQIETISAAAVSAPVFDPNGGGFVISSDVTITAAGAEHIYYTTNGDNPTKASNEYTGAIHLDATTTIKAIAYVGEESSLVVEKTFTLTDPKTVAEAYDELVSADLENVAVEGIVYDLSISSGNATYWISDDGNAGAKVLEVFKGKGIGGADVAVGDIREGDKVIVFGTLTIYTGGSEDVKEFKQGSSLLSLTRKTVESVAVTGTPTKTNYKVGDAFDPAGLTVTVTYDDASYATVAVADCSWEKDPATFDAAGTGLSVSVKATYDGVQSEAFAVEGLNVKAVPTFDDPNYEWQLVTSDAQLVAGKYYVIGSASKGKTAIKTITSGYLGTVASTIDDGVIAYNALGENTAIFELGGESGAWTLVEAIEEKQLTGATTANFVWDGATNTTWPISIDGENAIIGASDGYRVLYNVNSPRFKPYNSATSASMVLPQLYVWALKTYKLRYEANGGENAPAAQAAVAGEATVTDAEPTAPADKVFDKWNTQNDGLGADKVAGDVIDLSAGDVTLYAIWRDPETYSISYNANGGTLIDGEDALVQENITEGNVYIVKDNVYELAGKLFLGWQAGGVLYNEGQEIHPTEDMAFVAQWGDPTVTDFMLVTDVKQLKDGDKVYIVAAEYNVAMGTQHGTDYRNYVEIATQNNHVVALSVEPVEFTVGKDGDNFTFNDGTGYLYASSSTKNYLNTKADLDDNGKWAISIEADGKASIIAQGTNSRNDLKWNNNSGTQRFSCYGSGNIQKAVSIYKRPDYSRNVSGNYATICLPKAGKIDGASLYEIAYYGETSKKIFFDEIVNGEMEAGIPYIFLPAAGAEKIGVYYSDNTAADAPASNRNGLYGFYDLNDPAATHNITEDAGHYILYNNQYWLVSGRAAYVENYRAYIYLADITPSEPALAPGRRRISMSVNDTQTATGIESAEANEAPHKVLINGELFILRGEKMYNAKGQLVK